VVVTILIAGLWPFHAPRNNVTWLGERNGLQFSRHGSVVSTRDFPPRQSNPGSDSLEVWIAASSVTGRHTILAFEGERRDVPFRLQQDGSAFVVQRQNVDERGVRRTAEIRVEGSVSEREPVVLVVTFGPRETSIYVNGSLANTAQIMGSSINNFSGRLVLGNSPSASDSWTGQIVGLAIFGRQLTADEVAVRYSSRLKGEQTALVAIGSPVAAYPFNERTGQIIHSSIERAPDLSIPTSYLLLNPEFLTPPWRHFHSSFGYWADVAVNIGGFVPFGFCIYAYLSTLKKVKHSERITIGLGFITSLTIEVSQAFLPTRDSGINDLVTNTLGTVIGIMVFRYVWASALGAAVKNG
jgi:Concanavalin A-like lectin/glucanases superfamily/VanZ like family